MRLSVVACVLGTSEPVRRMMLRDVEFMLDICGPLQRMTLRGR